MSSRGAVSSCLMVAVVSPIPLGPYMVVPKPRIAWHFTGGSANRLALLRQDRLARLYALKEQLNKEDAAGGSLLQSRGGSILASAERHFPGGALLQGGACARCPICPSADDDAYRCNAWLLRGCKSYETPDATSPGQHISPPPHLSTTSSTFTPRKAMN